MPVDIVVWGKLTAQNVEEAQALLDKALAEFKARLLALLPKEPAYEKGSEVEIRDENLGNKFAK